MVLAVLAFGTFVVGTSELVIAGILPLVAADLAVSVPAAGQLVTVYALSFGVGAPVFAALLGGTPFSVKTRILGLLAVFLGGSAAGALAPSYGWLLGARVVTACAAGTFEVFATSGAAALVAPEKRGRAIALIVSGFSVALIVGVPLGTLIGAALGWRATFWALAAMGALTLTGTWLFFPRTSTTDRLEPSPVASSSSGFGAVLGALRRPGVGWAFAATGLLFTGQYVVGTYFAPLLTTRAGLDASGVAVALLLLGVGSAAGNVLGGSGADRWGIRRTAVFSLLGLAAAHAALASLGTAPLPAAIGMTLVGLTIGGFLPGWQHHLLVRAPGLAEVALALNLTALNAGVALGAFVGGIAFDAVGLRWLGFLSAAIVLLAVPAAVFATRRQPGPA